MFPTYFQRLAAYNRWANGLLYDAAAEVSDDDYHRDIGAFFGSLHGTLSHLAVTDRIWLRRLTGEGESYPQLDAQPWADFASLRAVREAEDQRIIDWTAALTDADFTQDFHYANMAGTPFTDRLDLLAAHFFNHQTHHRGQAHGLLSSLGHAPPSLDLIYFSRL